MRKSYKKQRGNIRFKRKLYKNYNIFNHFNFLNTIIKVMQRLNYHITY